MLKRFSAALSFLTVFRVPFTNSILSGKELVEGVSCFPLAGLVLGFIYAGAAWCLKGRIPGLLLSVLIVTLTAILTRGLHWDGLADLADGIWGGTTPERRLEIMKDSRTGSFGVLALILGAAVKIASIDALISENYFVPLLLAPVFSRFAMGLLAFGGTHARKDGLGKLFMQDLKIEHVVTAAIFAVVAAAIADFKSLLYLVPVFGCVLVFRLVSTKTLGGITGDVLGALNETAEMVVLVLGAWAGNR